MIEIGAGRGALTEPLLERAERVIAIEVDAVLVHYLRQKFHEAIEAGRLELIEGDVLKTDFSAVAARPVIAGNLPYYITSPILERVFNMSRRMGAGGVPGAGRGGRAHRGRAGHAGFWLSERAGADPRPRGDLFPVGREAFRPQPKVDSAVVRLTPRDAGAELGITDVAAFLKFAQHCFRHKRKTLRNNLGAVYGLKTIDALAGRAAARGTSGTAGAGCAVS